MVEKEPDVLAVKQAAESSPPASEEAELAQSVPLGGPDPPSCPEEQVQALNANAPSVPAEGHGSPGQDAGRPSSSEEQGSPGQDAGRPLSSKEQESPGEDVGRPLSSKEQGSPGQDADSYLSLEDGSSILESDCDSDQDLTPSSGPAEPEQLLRRRRNRRHRGLELVGSKEEGRPRRGGPAPGSGSSPQEEGASVSQSGCAMETVLRSLSPEVTGGEELMRELSARVQDVVRSSNWWEIHGIDSMLITVAFLILPAGFLCLRSEKVLVYLLGILILGVAHSTITVKGSHLASHGALTKSKRWGKVWAAFFIEVCSSFPTQVASYNHVNLHHAHTNIIGLGDSSVWKIPALNRFVYLFLAPLALPVLTPLAALGYLKEMALGRAVRALCLISLGLYGHYWLLLKVSGFQTVGSALFYMFLTRTVLSLPFIHINIFQHIGLAMFSPEDRPKRIQQMSHGVLNLPRNLLLDWTFGHSIISCHIEHHLFPCLSDNMCLKIKPIVSQYLMDRKLPYHEDSYLSRLRLFLVRYEELMVHMPPITRLVGIQ